MRQLLLSILTTFRGHQATGAILRLASYVLITAGAAAATFLTIPVLVRALGLEGFGAYSLLEPLLIASAGIALLGADHGVLKRIAYERSTLRAATGAMLPFTTPVLLIVGLAAALLVHYFLTVPVGWFAVGLLILAEGTLLFLTTAFRASDRLAPYGAAQLGRTGFTLLAVLAMAAALHGGHASVEAVVLIRLAVALPLVLTLLLYVRPVLRPDWGAYRESVHYGIFIVVTSALSVFVDNFDRYILGAFWGVQSVGAYVVSVKLAAIVGQSVIMPLMIWFPAERFRHLNDSDGGERFFRITALLMLALLVVASGAVFLFGEQLTRLISPSSEYSPTILLLLLLAGIATGMAHPLNIGLLKPGLSHYNVYPVSIAAVVGFGLAQVAIPRGGLMGAALVRAVTSLLIVGIIFVLSQRLHPVTFRPARLIFLLAMAGVILLLLSSGWLSGTSPWFKLFCFAAGIAGMAATLLFREFYTSASRRPSATVCD